MWTVPEEIKDAVEKLDRGEHERREQVDREAVMEIERVKGEIQGASKRKQDVNVSHEEVTVTKKARIEEEDQEDEGEESDESEEEDWQREAAAQLAAEAEAERVRLKEEAAREKREAEAEARRAQINMPDRVELSLEEGKALFKVGIHHLKKSLRHVDHFH